MEMNVELTNAAAQEIELELRYLEFHTRGGQVKLTMKEINAELRDLRKDFQIMLELLGASVCNDAFDPYPDN